MKNWKKSLLTLMLAGFTGYVLAQPNITMNAISAYQDFERAMQKKDMIAASKKLLEAKTYIDQSIATTEMQNEPKTLYYKGEIYFMVAALAAQGEADFKQFDAEKTGEEAVNCYKASMKYKTKKVDKTPEITMKMNTIRLAGFMQGIDLYGKKEYEKAGQMFEGCVGAMDVVGQLDTVSAFNAGLCAELLAEDAGKKCKADKDTICETKTKKWETAAKYYKMCADAGYQGPDMVIRYTDILMNLGKKEEASAAIIAAKAKFPKSNSIIIQEFNYYISIGDNASAEKALNEAIKLSPKDPILYFNAGAIYNDLKRYAEAEASYKKAIEIDGKYFDAYFNLGAMYYNQGADLYNEINNISDNAKYEAEKKRADELFKSALPYLEKARELNAKDRNNLIMLRTIYARLSMNDKWKEVDTVLKNG